MTRVFVYGTLKRGGGNHSVLAGQQFLGEARTPPGFTLFSLGDYPGMVRAPDDKDGVTGELWSVDAACLRRLDELEGVAEGLYERVGVQLAPPFADRPAETYLYLRDLTGRKALGSDWSI
ncbi:MAG: gamma-glutamylcyclotransferase [Opitutae bacterium]|nr:gamma-glutamylcyclotransferase [Opitutae bacterium]